MGKKVAALVTNQFEDVELTSPRKALESAGNHVDVIEKQAGSTIVGEHGTKAKVDKSIDDVKPDDYDALLLPGGFSPDQLRVDDRFVNFVKSFLMSNKPVFAICHGPQFFMQSGLANQLTLTAYTTIRTDLFYAGARVKNQALVVDKKHNLYTSRTPDDLDQFNPAIVKALK